MSGLCTLGDGFEAWGDVWDVTSIGNDEQSPITAADSFRDVGAMRRSYTGLADTTTPSLV